jgi:DNA-binding response OmpR family regulator
MKATILFAEDDIPFQTLIADQLQQEGYAVTTASDGAEAVELLNAQGFDLALLDIRMPGKDGLEVLQVIRARSPWTRVLMLTGVDDFSVALDAMKLGANDYITKPFSLDDLLSCITRALER